MNERPLFDVAALSTTCPVPGCQAIRLPDQDRVVTCAHDQAVAIGDVPGRRPRGCLNTYDPSTSPIPY